MAERVLPIVPGGWRCIVADPPWSFRDKGSRIAPDWKRARRGYATMGLAGIAALPVRDVAAPDALLFLWTTSAHLLDGSATAVARAWGFEPKTTIAWVKVAKNQKGAEPGRPRVRFGGGKYTRGAHELVVVARRGRARVLVKNVPSVLFAPRGRHSEKPEELQDLAERLAAGPYLELFARRRRAAWTCWGDQLPSAVGAEEAA